MKMKLQLKLNNKSEESYWMSIVLAYCKLGVAPKVSVENADSIIEDLRSRRGSDAKNSENSSIDFNKYMTNGLESIAKGIYNLNGGTLSDFAKMLSEIKIDFQEDKIGAVRELRTRTGISMNEAKSIIDLVYLHQVDCLNIGL